MRLSDWIEQEGRGALTRLAERSGVCYPTVHAIYAGTQTPLYATAVKISAATNNAVTVDELCSPAPRGSQSRNARVNCKRRRDAANGGINGRKRRKARA